MRTAFVAFDKNGDGQIDKKELKAVFTDKGTDVTDEELDRFMKQCDTNGDGMMNYEEFLNRM